MSSTRTIDPIWWGSSTQQQAVTHANPTNGRWVISFETSANETNGVFQLISFGQTGWCLTEPTSGNQLYTAPCVNTPGSDADKRQNWGLIAPSGSTNGRYALVSNYDGKCADVLNNSDYDGAWVGAWTCNSTYGSTNQQWTLTDGDGSVSGLSKWPLSTIVPAQLAKEYIGGLARQALQRKTPGSVTFCNWGAYVAWATVNYARLTPSMGFQNGWQTPDLLLDQCSSLPIPAGEGLSAQITIHLHAAQGNLIAATYFLTAAYTKTTFQFYGNTCSPSFGVDANDDLSVLLTNVVNANIGGTCNTPSKDVGNLPSKVSAVQSTVDTNLAALNQQLGITR